MSSDISLESTLMRFMILTNIRNYAKGFKEDGFEDPPNLAKKNCHDLKINTLCFVESNETYFDRDIRVDHIFEKYDYSSPKKVAPRAGILTNHAMIWWDKKNGHAKKEPPNTICIMDLHRGSNE